jgi:nitrate/nitrite transporter NarK
MTSASISGSGGGRVVVVVARVVVVVAMVVVVVEVVVVVWTVVLVVIGLLLVVVAPEVVQDTRSREDAVRRAGRRRPDPRTIRPLPRLL